MKKAGQLLRKSGEKPVLDSLKAVDDDLFEDDRRPVGVGVHLTAGVQSIGEPRGPGRAGVIVSAMLRTRRSRLLLKCSGGI